MKSEWVTKFVQRDDDRGDIVVRRSNEDGMVSITDRETDEQIHIAKHHLRPIVDALLEIANENDCVSGNKPVFPFGQDDWTQEAIVHDSEVGCSLKIMRRGDGLMCIDNPATDHTVFMSLETMKALGECIAAYKPKPVTVDGMAALKHIMDGGGAYRMGYGPDNDIRMDGGRLALRGGYLHTIEFDDILATDWVLEP